MEQPNYVLRTMESGFVPIKQSTGFVVFKIIIFIIIGMIILGSLLFQANLFAELSWIAKVALIVSVIYIIKVRFTHVDVQSPLELWFYDDYFIMYLPRKQYDRRVTRMVYNRMNYSDISRCVYLKQPKRFHIYGNGISTWYNYRANGTLPPAPSAVKHYTNWLMYFAVRYVNEVEIIQQIEAHSPIRVNVINEWEV